MINPLMKSFVVGAFVLLFISPRAVAIEVNRCSSIGSNIPHRQDFIRLPLTQSKPLGVPPGVDDSTLPAAVRLRLVVNRVGKITSVCVLRKTDSDGQPLLEEAAVASLAQWSYPADFGLHGNLHLSYTEVWGEVVVRFEPPSSKSGIGRRADGAGLR
jgi:hypothetical protein